MLVNQSIETTFGVSSADAEVIQFTAPALTHDDYLIEQTLGGDESAFESLLRKHHKRVFSIARRFFRSRETVEDIVQETFSKAFFSWRHTGAERLSTSGWQELPSIIAMMNCDDEKNAASH